MVKIGVVPATGEFVHKPLFKALGELLNYSLEVADSRFGLDSDAIVYLNGDWEAAQESSRRGIPCFCFIQRDECMRDIRKKEVRLHDDPRLDQRLRGKLLALDDFDSFCPLDCLPGQKPLASIDGVPVWVYQNAGEHPVFFSSIGPPVLNEGDFLFHHFNSKKFMGILPLLHFLREWSEYPKWKVEMRAVLMFDDPNLHWKSYGNLRYEDLVALAKRDGFHVAIATIPIDSWYVHSGTVHLFREHGEHLSLLIHGIDHTKQELANANREEDQLFWLSQGLQRIQKLEKKSGLSVSRVMAPPHGACSESMMNSMMLMGFEGACISPGSLWRYNSLEGRRLATGMEMADILAGGFPIVRRFRMSRTCLNDIVISAYLDQPIIAVEHQACLSSGTSILTETAQMINSLGAVRWMDMRNMMRSNYRTMRDADTLKVRMYSRRIQIAIPAEIDRIYIEAPWLQRETTRNILILDGNGVLLKQLTIESIGEPIPISTKSPVEVVFPAASKMKIPESLGMKLPIWPIIRRILTEGRDRMLL